MPSAAEGTAFLNTPAQSGCMESTRKALRSGDLYKDTYERLACSACEKTLATKNPEDEVYTIRHCEECGRRWKELR